MLEVGAILAPSLQAEGLEVCRDIVGCLAVAILAGAAPAELFAGELVEPRLAVFDGDGCGALAAIICEWLANSLCWQLCDGQAHEDGEGLGVAGQSAGEEGWHS